MAGERVLQGGLPPVTVPAGPVAEIACDESGFTGTNLLDPATPVITHASVDLRAAEAVELITALRATFTFSPYEVKSGRFRDEALDWLLARLAGRAHVYLARKDFFLVTRLVDLFVEGPSYASLARPSPVALDLYEAGDPGELLTAFVELVRVKRRRPDPRTAERFSAIFGAERVRTVLDRLERNDRSIPPPLEPLMPALAATVLSWSDGGRRVLVTHDEQSALTAGRLTRLQQALAGDDGVSPLAGLVMADSRDDPRVQVADLLAGAARRAHGATGLTTTMIHV